ncbi:MAG: glycyl-radical enzyme activating protein [Candidatus Thorarchaeota archaeon]
MNEKTLIVDIKRNALDDGPGIRTLIFFKGCPLSCVWCQNPEAKSPFTELSFDKEMCVECRKCLEVCDQNAINFDYKYRVDRSICNLCGRCIEFCPNNALKLVGRNYTINELINIILKDKVFYDNSGGGVTLSGGEPLYHMDFVHNLLKELKKEEIHICIETCGFYNTKQFEKLILPYIDLIYFDIKILESNLHAQYCKAPNKLILENFEILNNKRKIEVLPRIPLIPNITDTSENLRKIADYLKSLQIKKIWFLPYNPLWLSKSEKIGINPLYTHSQWISNEKKEQVKAIFSNFDYNNF